jgi:ATP-dependent DNA ligase
VRRWCLNVDGSSDFEALHSRKHDHEVQLYAFDILALDGDDLRGLPLSLRKTNLARLLARRPDGKVKNPGHPAYRRVQDSLAREGPS